MPDPIQQPAACYAPPTVDPDPACEGPGPLACYESRGASSETSSASGTGGASSTQQTSQPSNQGGTSGSAPRDEPSAGTRSLCERRLATNDVLCDILGSVAAGRIGGRRMTQAIVGKLISDACVVTAEWLERHTGACAPKK